MSSSADGTSQRGIGLAVGKRQTPTSEAVLIGRTPPPRSREGTHPRPRLTRVEHGNPDRVRAARWRFGRPTVRKAESSGGNRMLKKPMPVDESRQEANTRWRLLQAAVLDNWPDTRPCAWALKGALT